MMKDLCVRRDVRDLDRLVIVRILLEWRVKCHSSGKGITVSFIAERIQS